MTQQINPCVFCGKRARITLTRTLDNKAVSVCRECVPRRKKLSWAENPTVDALEAAKTLTDKQKANVI